jgi:hypothetical protein
MNALQMTRHRARYVISWAVLVGLGVALLACQRGQETVFSPTSASLISIGTHGGCAIRADDTLACWSQPWSSSHLDAPPDGAFKSVSVGGSYGCAIRVDDTLICWGHDFRIAPNGAFIDVDAAINKVCGVRANGTTICWSRYPLVEQVRFPEGLSPVRQVITAFHYDCVLQIDDLVTCAAKQGSETVLPAVPEGTFRHISTGIWHTCGIRTDNTAACWGGLNDHGETTVPSGTFKAISADSWFTCGIRTDSTLVCWGYNRSGQANPPAGTFAAVSAGIHEACAIRTDGELVCWGDDDGDSSTSPHWALPSGPFKVSQK